MTEQYYCVNCKQIRELNTHGRCVTCDSAQVISKFVLLQAEASLELDNKKRSTLPRLTLYCVRFGRFYTTLYARDSNEAFKRAWHPETTWQLEGDELSLRELTTYGTCEAVNAQKTLDNDTTLR